MLDLNFEGVGKNELVCSDHFDDLQFSKTNVTRRLIATAVPKSVISEVRTSEMLIMSILY